MSKNIYDIARHVNVKFGLRDIHKAKKIVAECFDYIPDAVEKGHDVRIQNLGTFKKVLKQNVKNNLTGKFIGNQWQTKFSFSTVFSNRIKRQRTDYYDNENKKSEDLL